MFTLYYMAYVELFPAGTGTKWPNVFKSYGIMCVYEEFVRFSYLVMVNCANSFFIFRKGIIGDEDKRFVQWRKY